MEKKITVQGVGEVKQEVILKLTEDVIKRLDRETAELDKLFPRPTAEEVARIVAEGPKAVDEILDTPETAAVAVDNAGPDDEETTTTAAPTTTTTTAQAVTNTVTAPATVETPVATAAPTPAPTPVQTVSAPTLPTPSAAVAQTAAPAVTAPSPTQPTATTLAGTSDEDFLKTLNV